MHFTTLQTIYYNYLFFYLTLRSSKYMLMLIIEKQYMHLFSIHSFAFVKETNVEKTMALCLTVSVCLSVCLIYYVWAVFMLC